MESYRYNPSKIDVISWLGIHNVKNELYEKAVMFFERASQIQPKEVKWKLMVASCYRRMNLYQQALKLYEEIIQEHPDNIECLRYLVSICKDLGMKYDHYSMQLKKLERLHEARQGLMPNQQPGYDYYGGAPEGAQQQQEYGYDPGRPGDAPQQRMGNEDNYGAPQQQKRFIQQKEEKEEKEDDWGEIDDLLPS